MSRGPLFSASKLALSASLLLAVPAHSFSDKDFEIDPLSGAKNDGRSSIPSAPGQDSRIFNSIVSPRPFQETQASPSLPAKRRIVPAPGSLSFGAGASSMTLQDGLRHKEQQKNTAPESFVERQVDEEANKSLESGLFQEFSKDVAKFYACQEKDSDWYLKRSFDQLKNTIVQSLDLQAISTTPEALQEMLKRELKIEGELDATNKAYLERLSAFAVDFSKSILKIRTEKSGVAWKERLGGNKGILMTYGEHATAERWNATGKDAVFSIPDASLRAPLCKEDNKATAQDRDRADRAIREELAYKPHKDEKPADTSPANPDPDDPKASNGIEEDKPEDENDFIAPEDATNQTPVTPDTENPEKTELDVPVVDPMQNNAANVSREGLNKVLDKVNKFKMSTITPYAEHTEKRFEILTKKQRKTPEEAGKIIGQQDLKRWTRLQTNKSIPDVQRRIRYILIKSYCDDKSLLEVYKKAFQNDEKALSGYLATVQGEKICKEVNEWLQANPE